VFLRHLFGVHDLYSLYADSAVIVKALARVSKEIDPDNNRQTFAAGEMV
jgi:hypothetical protein